MKSRFLSNINCLDGLGFETEGCGYTLAWAHAVTALAESRPVPKAMEIEPEEMAGCELGDLPPEPMHCGPPGCDHAPAGLLGLPQKQRIVLEEVIFAGRVKVKGLVNACRGTACRAPTPILSE
jgi:hypothetical protein